MGLGNGSFEGEYREVVWPEIKVAEGWFPFIKEGSVNPEGNGPTVRPEYKEAPLIVDPRRVRDGAKAQCWFTRWKYIEAGVMQTFQVPLDNKVTFRVWAHCWCSDSDDPMADDGEMYVSVGIDPEGGDDPWHNRVKWRGDVRLTSSWQKLTVTTTPKRGVATAFIRAWNKYRLSHNDVYIDDATVTLTPIQPTPTGECLYDPRDIANAIALIEARLDMLQTAVMAHVDQKLAAHLAAVRELINKRDPVIWPKD